MRLKGIIARVLVAVLSFQLAAFPAVSAVQGIGFSDRSSLGIQKSRSDFSVCNQCIVSGKATAAFGASSLVGTANGAVSGDIDLGDILKDAAFAAATSYLAQSINLKAQGNLEGAKEAATKAKDAIAATDKVAQTGAKATRTFNILGDKPWGEAFQKGIFGGTKLTPANILEGAFDGALKAGISTTVRGTDFKKSFTTSLVTNIVALGLADAQIKIGSVFKDEDGNPINGGEGSLGHILLHGAAGCAAAELTGARCAAGAAGGIAQAVYASALEGKGPNPLADPGGYAAWRARVSSHAEVIGAAVGYFASGGRAENVSAAASIARSGIQNNYLTHEEERIAIKSEHC